MSKQKRRSWTKREEEYLLEQVMSNPKTQKKIIFQQVANDLNRSVSVVTSHWYSTIVPNIDNYDIEKQEPVKKTFWERIISFFKL